MVTKENINFNSSFSNISYEDIDATAWPATSHQTNQVAEAKIRDFQRRRFAKLGQAALRWLDPELAA